MRKYRGLILSSVVFFSLISLKTTASAEEMSLYCKDPKRLGLYEQCQEIVVLEKTGSKVRAYSKPQKLVLNLDPKLIFQARSLKSKDKMKIGEKILVSSNVLWTSSRMGYQSICQLSGRGSLKNNLLEVSCGRKQSDRIYRDIAYRVEPYRFHSKHEPRI